MPKVSTGSIITQTGTLRVSLAISGYIPTPSRVGRDISMSTNASFHSIRLFGMLSGQPVKFHTNRGLSGQDYVNRSPYGPYRDFRDSTIPYRVCFSTNRGLSGRASVNRVHSGSYRGFSVFLVLIGLILTLSGVIGNF